MHISEAFPSKYLKASDLQGRNVNVKMGRVDQEAINGEKKLILFFQGKEKGMVLNKTNANNIAAIYGSETEDWYGKPIVLVEAMVDYQGQSVPAIRVRAPRREEQQPPQRRTGGVSDNLRDDPISSGPPAGHPADRDLDDPIPF